MRDERREAALARRGRTAGRCRLFTQCRRHAPLQARLKRCAGGGDLERALEQVFGIGAQAVARARRRNRGGVDAGVPVGADHDFLPADPALEGVVVHGQLPHARCRAGVEEQLEPRRLQPADPVREREPALELAQRQRLPVGAQDEAAPDLRGQPVGIALASEPRHLLLVLEGRDLGEVEDVNGVEPVARRHDLGVAVGREVAERMRECRCGHGEGGEHSDGQDQALHEAYLRAVGLHRSEKCGFVSTARANQRRASAS